MSMVSTGDAERWADDGPGTGLIEDADAVRQRRTAIRKIAATPRGPARLAVFKLSVSELRALARDAKLDHIATVDRLWEAADAYDLIADFDEDAIQAVLADGPWSPVLEDVIERSPNTDPPPDDAPPPSSPQDYGLPVADHKSATARIVLIPFDEIRLDRTRHDLIKGLIPREGLTVVWGKPKSGKSFFTFDLLMHVALGREYRGRRVHPGPVVYCAFEGAAGLKARVEAYRQRHLTKADKNVPFSLMPLRLDLVKDHAALIAEIRATLGDVAPVCVALDTLNRSLRGSESSDEDMSAYVNAADAIREAFGCAVIIVHHCGIDGSRPRGHTALTGAVEAQLAVARDAAGNVTVEVEYMKDGPEGDKVTSRLEVIEVGEDEDGGTITSCVILPAENAGVVPPRPKVTGAARIALELLQRAIVDAGELVPANNHVPDRAIGVTLTLWRRYCYDGSVSAGETPAARQKAFIRASTVLRSRGLIGVWGEWVWLAS